MSKVLLSAATATILLLASPATNAIPAFARQTGNDCSTCHFQHYPTLNEVGRDFKSGGYTDMGKGKQEKIEKDDISLPGILNTSLFLKLRYQKTNGIELPGERTTNSGEWQFPDEFSLLFGGRISRNIGFFLEGQLASHDEPFLANFKIPIMFEVGDSQIGVIPFTSQDLGASFGFELLSTGAVHNIKSMEHGAESSAQQYIGTDTSAEGLALIYYHRLFHINVTKWSPNHAATAEGRANGRPSATYLRAAATPAIKDWDLGFGVQVWSGSAETDDGAGTGTVTKLNTKAWAIDAQAQGKVGNLPLGVYLSHATAQGTATGATPNLFNTNPNNKKATAIAAELGVLPGKATVMLAYRKGDTGDVTNSGDNAFTLGGTYQIVQNVQLQLQFSKRSGSLYRSPQEFGDRLFTFMFSAGF
jgi:hypothetical protein